MRRLNYPKMLLGNFGLCTYCGGEHGDEAEHVIPFCYCGLSSEDNRRSVGPQVWSCRKCNSFLGAKVFNSFQERALYVSNSYAELRGKYGTCWREWELVRLSWELRQFVQQRIGVDRALKAASDWFNSDAYLFNLECVTFEPMLDKAHPRFHCAYYEFFRSTIDSVRRYFDSRSRFRAAWNWRPEAN